VRENLKTALGQCFPSLFNVPVFVSAWIPGIPEVVNLLELPNFIELVKVV
jgi:hypothetical protein